jgi:hypothetical protein
MAKNKPSKGWIDKGCSCRWICINGKEMLEHRYVMEQFLNRKLERNEVVHHINGNRFDNRIENLKVMTKGEHSTIHNTGKSRTGNKMPHRTQEQIEKYRKAALNRHPPTEETKTKISKAIKMIRANRFWSTKKVNHTTTSVSGF